MKLVIVFFSKLCVLVYIYYYLFKFIYYIYDLILWDFFFQHLTVVLSGL